jgi:hypothetical protein
MQTMNLPPRMSAEMAPWSQTKSALLVAATEARAISKVPTTSMTIMLNLFRIQSSETSTAAARRLTIPLKIRNTTLTIRVATNTSVLIHRLLAMILPLGLVLPSAERSKTMTPFQLVELPLQCCEGTCLPTLPRKEELCTTFERLAKAMPVLKVILV